MARADLNLNTPPQISHLIILGFLLLLAAAYLGRSYQHESNSHMDVTEQERIHMHDERAPEIGY